MLLTSLLLSLCSRLLVSASQDGKLIIWDISPLVHTWCLGKFLRPSDSAGNLSWAGAWLEGREEELSRLAIIPFIHTWRRDSVDGGGGRTLMGDSLWVGTDTPCGYDGTGSRDVEG